MVRLGAFCLVACLVGCVSTGSQKTPTLTKGVNNVEEMQKLLESALVGKGLTDAEEILKEEGFARSKPIEQEELLSDEGVEQPELANQVEFHRSNLAGLFRNEFWRLNLELDPNRCVKTVKVKMIFEGF